MVMGGGHQVRLDWVEKGGDGGGRNELRLDLGVDGRRRTSGMGAEGHNVGLDWREKSDGARGHKHGHKGY